MQNPAIVLVLLCFDQKHCFLMKHAFCILKGVAVLNRYPVVDGPALSVARTNAYILVAGYANCL